MTFESSGPVAVGIDAAIVADHQVTLRRPEPGRPGVIVERFKVGSTVAGLSQLTERLSAFPGSVVVCEPTSMTWLSIQIAAERAGCEMSLIGTRHSARLRGALVGKHKSDVIDADMLSRAGEFFALDPTRPPTPQELALRRVVQLRHRQVVAQNRTHRRIVSLASWAFPDVWRPLASSRAASLGVLRRWPNLAGLSRARTATIAEVIAANTRGVSDVHRRAERVRDGARAWVEFWDGRLDLDALEWELFELLDDYDTARQRIGRATAEMTRRWEQRWGDDPVLMSVPGMGVITAPIVRAFFGDGQHLDDAKAAQSYVGMNPSNWSSGTVAQPSRSITKEGPEELRLAFYQAANAARMVDPQLAEFYRRLMVERGHCHAKATCAVARKLIGRTWAIITSGTPYEMRGLAGEPITRRQARQLVTDLAVPDRIRARTRSHSTATRRGRLAS
ncbi:MAG: IS110 family transposase [Actinomycetota bacterium]|nr:IS110 family transposase [Actinomycetota bacterium]